MKSGPQVGIIVSSFILIFFSGFMFGIYGTLKFSHTPQHGEKVASEIDIIRTAAERNGIEYGSEDWFILLIWGDF